MSLLIREADLDGDRQQVIPFLRRHLTPQSDEKRYDWLYRDNPHGPALVWLAFERETQTLVGAAGAFPRRFHVGGQVRTVAVLGDFCIHERYRTLGPALRLQKACLSGIDGRRIALCYDFPSQSMMAVYKRLRCQPAGEMVRLSRPLRVDRKVGNVIKVSWVSRPVSLAGNLALSLLYPLKTETTAGSIECHDGLCGEEFTALAETVADRFGSCLHRSADYLNWRYFADPLCRYQMVTLRCQGALVGYAVYAHLGADAVIADLFGLLETADIRVLVAEIIRRLKKQGTMTLSVSILRSHPWGGVLQQLGFKSRETCPVVVYEPFTGADMMSGAEGKDWLLLQGDRDS